MRSRRAALPALAGLVMLATPAGALPPRMRMASLCTGGGLVRMALLVDEEMPDPDDCMKACHAMCEGRKKPGRRTRLA